MLVRELLPSLLTLLALVACCSESPQGSCRSNRECDRDWEVCAAGGPKDPEGCARETFGHCRPRMWCGPLCVFGDVTGDEDEPAPRIYTTSCDDFGDASVSDLGASLDSSADVGSPDASPPD